MTADLRALQAWLRLHFPSLEAVEKQDAHSSPYLSVRPSTFHPVLATAPSVHLNIYVKVTQSELSDNSTTDLSLRKICL